MLRSLLPTLLVFMVIVHTFMRMLRSMLQTTHLIRGYVVKQMLHSFKQTRDSFMPMLRLILQIHFLVVRQLITLHVLLPMLLSFVLTIRWMQTMVVQLQVQLVLLVMFVLTMLLQILVLHRLLEHQDYN
jgi:hypothetical protein